MTGWWTPLDLYCERTDPSFWAEPLNAVSNLAFLLAALAAFLDWRRRGGGDGAVLALIAVAAAVGAGSAAFHTLATRGAVLLDVLPIAAFIYGYFWLALRRFLKMPAWIAVLVLLAFIAASQVWERSLPPGFLNGSGAYLPALAAMLAIGALVRGTDSGRAILLAAAIFCLSLTFRTIDNAVCPSLPIGTHFLWHLLNAAVLYWLLRAAMAGAPGVAPAPIIRS